MVQFYRLLADEPKLVLAPKGGTPVAFPGAISLFEAPCIPALAQLGEQEAFEVVHLLQAQHIRIKAVKYVQDCFLASMPVQDFCVGLRKVAGRRIAVRKHVVRCHRNRVVARNPTSCPTQPAAIAE
jgi:hypothetical protein